VTAADPQLDSGNVISAQQKSKNMSTSPATSSAMPSQKRPLEEPSSPSAPGDQPDAKRPALDKVIKGDSATSLVPEAPAVTSGETAAAAVEAKPELPQTQAIPSTSSLLASNGHSAVTSTDETSWLHVRSIISSAEAATVIGKGGENVTLIRKMSGAKCTVSDYSRGAIERVLTVSGPVDAVAKVSGTFFGRAC
jgi:heterogeneous nuclear rnp K-like protein 2